MLSACARPVTPSDLGHLLERDTAQHFGEYRSAVQTSDVIAQIETGSVGQIDLAEALRLAMERNSDIRLAANRVSKAQAERMNAVFGYLPQISATGNQNQVKQEVLSSDNAVFALGQAKYGARDYVVSASQPIFDLSRIYGIRISRTLMAASEVDYVAAVQEVMFATYDTYIGMLQAVEKISSLVQRRRLLEQKARAEQRRANSGITSAAGLFAANIEIADLSIDLAQYRSELAKLRGELSILTGTPVGGVASLNLPPQLTSQRIDISVQDAVDRAMEQNPKILRSIIGVAEADLKTRQALAADFSPVVSAISNFTYEDRGGSRFGGGSENEDLTIGVRVMVPIFNSRGTGYAHTVARIDFQDSKDQFVAQKRKIAAEISATLQRMRDLKESLARARNAFQSAQGMVRSEQSLVEAGQSQDFLVTVLKSRALEAKERMRHYELEFLRARGRFEFLSGINLGQVAQ